MWGLCSSFKNDVRRGTFQEDLQRCMSRGRRSTKDMFISDVRRSGRWFPERGCILENQIFRFAEMILRDRCSTSYDVPSLVRGRRSTFDRWTRKIAKRIGTKLLALHSTFHFWRKSLRIALFPTCQVRVVRFYQSSSSSASASSASASSASASASSASSPATSSSQSRFQLAQPDLHRELQIPVGTAGPQPRVAHRMQWALPDLNRELQIPVGTAGPQPRAPDPSGHRRNSTASSRSQWALPDPNRDFQIAVCTAGPQPRLPDRSGHCRTSTGRKDVR